MIAKLVFAVSVALAVYHYAGYPALVMLLAARRRGRAAASETPQTCSSVALVIAAFNEETVIGSKIDNALSLDCPCGPLQIIVVTDGSSDSTPQVAASYQNRGVICLHDPQRRGKAHALNRGVAAATSDVVVLSDANNFYSQDAISLLVARLSAQGVGGVTGVKKVIEDAARAASTGDGLYWKYESRIKQAESDIGGTVTADGEIFALWRRLYQPIPPGVVNDDMYLTLRLVEQGYRVEYESRATAVEQGSFTLREDINVKARMIAGGLQGLFADKRTIFFSGWFSVRFFSHKTLRWLMPFVLAAAFVSNAALLGSPGYRVLFVAQCALLAGALCGYVSYLLRGQAPKIFYVPYYFVCMNLAVAAGWYRFVIGRQQVTWTKARR
jgi:cellulose synthase/poly-beta-1,6-N-acetylglucosamine synthase-like glycosyltransferase